MISTVPSERHTDASAGCWKGIGGQGDTVLGGALVNGEGVVGGGIGERLKF